MPVTSNAVEFAEHILTGAREVQVGSRVGVSAAALVYTTAIRAKILADTPNDPNRLSGVGKKGAAVGVGFSFKGQVGPAPSALVRARGPLHLLERDTKSHSMTASRGERGRANKRPNSRSTVGKGHPGTKGKHPFELGIVEATPAANKVLGEAVVASVTRAFR